MLVSADADWNKWHAPSRIGAGQPLTTPYQEDTIALLARGAVVAMAHIRCVPPSKSELQCDHTLTRASGRVGVGDPQRRWRAWAGMAQRRARHEPAPREGRPARRGRCAHCQRRHRARPSSRTDRQRRWPCLWCAACRIVCPRSARLNGAASATAIFQRLRNHRHGDEPAPGTVSGGGHGRAVPGLAGHDAGPRADALDCTACEVASLARLPFLTAAATVSRLGRRPFCSTSATSGATRSTIPRASSTGWRTLPTTPSSAAPLTRVRCSTGQAATNVGLASLIERGRSVWATLPSAMLLTTAMDDERVPFWHAVKYTARLRQLATTRVRRARRPQPPAGAP